MNNQITNVNIEDVLSSVRRLVSDDKRTEKPTEASQEDPFIHTEERLVLTDPLDISGDEVTPVEGADTTPDVSPEPAQTAPTQASEPQTNAEPDLREPGEDIENDVIIADDFMIGDSVDVADPRDEQAMASLEETIAGLEFVISQQGISFEPDGSEMPSEPAASYQELARQVADAETAHDSAPAASVSDSGDPLVSEMPDDTQSPTVVENTVTATEISADEADNPEAEWQGWAEPVAMAPQSEQSAEDTARPEVSVAPKTTEAREAEHTLDATPPASNEQDDLPTAPAENAETPNLSSVDDVSVAGADFVDDASIASTGSDILSEDIDLKELVGDLVREELQGELGERITRNVRKLVRREVQRILAAQALK